MNFKAVLISICLGACLSACSHAPQRTTDVENETVSGRVDHSPVQELDPLEPTLEPNITSDTDVEIHSLELNKTIDLPASGLISRIRHGFAFPELLTKDVLQHEKWASEHPSYLINLFNRAEPFLYFIVEEIERRGLPMELALLPAVESAYDPGAVSRSKAAGLWQFVPATGKGFGLQQNWWYDGRHDPYASTYAALDYLEQLHKMFDQDWFIALAAYNAGPGTLRRVIRKAKAANKPTDYVSLKLRAETRRYIPKLISLKRILLAPEKFGVKLPHIANQPYFGVLQLNSQIDLEDFANASNIEPKLLRHLNRGFKRWASAPEGPSRLLVPLDKNGEFTYAVAALSQAKVVNYKHHTIRTGDTLGAIARRYGVSVDALKTSNKLKSTRIRAGKSLLIPTKDNLADSLNAEESVSNSNKVAESKVTHRVLAGETIWSIAKRYKVNMNHLMRWNNLNHGDILSLNQMLDVFLK